MTIFENGKQLDPDVADALYELGNVGVGKATNALGKMIDKRITIKAPRITPYKADLSAFIGDHENKLTLGILMLLNKNLGGAILIILDEKLIIELVRGLTGVEYKDSQLLKDEDCLSVIQEVANIMSSSYATAIGSYTGLRIYMTPVMIGVESVKQLISYPVEKMSLDPKNCICIDTSFTVQDEEKGSYNCSGNILVFPDDSSIDIMMETLLK